MTSALRLHRVSKTFTGQKALDEVTLDIPRGKVTALLGMNGSGKSTLIKILAGVYDPDPGSALSIGDREYSLPLTPQRAHDAGLRFLHQDLGLIEMLTVADNFALADGFAAKGMFAPINRRRHHDHAERILSMLAVDVSPNRLVRDLSPSERTMVAIARAFQSEEATVESLRQRVLVLDEPTASLPAHEADRVLEMVESLRAHGGTAVYVSHRIEEVMRVADQVAILRDGRLVVDEPLGETSTSALVAKIVGRQLTPAPLRDATVREGGVLVTVNDLSGHRLQGVNLSVRSGEILGVTGLMGCGRSELVRVLAGAQQPEAGSMTLEGQNYAPKDPAEAIFAGITCVPQNRRRDGVVLDLSVAENLTLGRVKQFARWAAVDRDAEQTHVQRLMTEYLVKAATPMASVRTLSGGNQQKVVVARAASSQPRLLVLDEPSQGVDALAKQEIANVLRGLADTGVAILVASTDYDDFPGLVDRVVILDRGRVSGELTGDDISEDHIALAIQRNAA
ncbi:MAG: sugar ABC transporter ATP-binding protein [Micrococcaceae bacterium]